MLLIILQNQLSVFFSFYVHFHLHGFLFYFHSFLALC